MAVQTSLQLFTLRDALESDLEGVLAKVAAYGLTAVEPYDYAAMDAATSLEFAVIEFDHYEGDIYDAIVQSRLFIERRRG